jgi:hypothetical protein
VGDLALHSDSQCGAFANWKRTVVEVEMKGFFTGCTVDAARPLARRGMRATTSEGKKG